MILSPKREPVEVKLQRKYEMFFLGRETGLQSHNTV